MQNFPLLSANIYIYICSYMTYEDIALGFDQNVMYENYSKRGFMIICFSRCILSCFFKNTIQELTIQLSNPITNLNIRQSYLADRYCI